QHVRWHTLRRAATGVCGTALPFSLLISFSQRGERLRLYTSLCALCGEFLLAKDSLKQFCAFSSYSPRRSLIPCRCPKSRGRAKGLCAASGKALHRLSRLGYQPLCPPDPLRTMHAASCAACTRC